VTKISTISLALTCAVACGDGVPKPRPGIEPAIARSLGEHFGAPVVATCSWIGTVAVGCSATFPGGATLAIAVDGRQWRVAGRVFATAPIAAYVRAELAELGRSDRVDCAPFVHANERIACALGGGGAVFVDVGDVGEGPTVNTPARPEGPSVNIELELDPAVAAIRAEAPHDADLVRMSHALDISGEDE
jgi:hypothetical protein